jgi:hypothetical protein
MKRRDFTSRRRGPRHVRLWRTHSKAGGYGVSACSCGATKAIPYRRLTSLQSLKRLRIWVGPTAATCGWTFGGRR